MTPTPQTEGESLRAGRGLVYLTVARVVFLLTRLLYFLALPRLLSGPTEYGSFSVAVGLTLVAATTFNHGTHQAVSKLAAEDLARADEVRTAALSSRVWIGAAVAGLYLALAAPLARAFNDAALEPLLKIGAVAAPSYAFFAAFTGYASAVGKFGRQALIDMWVSFTKLLAVVAAAYFTGRAAAALWGFALTQWGGVVLGALLLGIRPRRGTFSLKTLLSYESALMGFALVMNIAVQADLFLLKALLPPELAGPQAGYYAAAQIFAQVPAALGVSITMVLLPLVSGALGRGDEPAARAHVRRYLLLALVILLLAGTLISANAPLLIGLLYPEGYTRAAPALTLLVYGGAAYTLLLIATAALTGSGAPRTALVCALGYLALMGAWGTTLIPRLQMLGSAAAHLGGGLCAVTLALFLLHRRLGATLPLRKTLGALAAAALAYGAAAVLPAPSEGVPAMLLALAGRLVIQIATFALALLALRVSDWDEIKRLFTELRGN